jgi:hypothetical protein
MQYDTFTVRYFKNLDLPASVQALLLDRLHLDLKALSSKVQEALQISKEAMEACTAKQAQQATQAEQAASEGTEWKKCEGTCNTLITDAVNQEIGSTAFMLKLLADSVIRPDGQPHRLKIGLDPSFYKGTEEKRGTGNGSSCRLLTGRWKDDAPYLHLVLPKKKGPGANGRLVMGFGPSASGKTYWAKTILRLLAQADPLFPEVFFAVDGGLVRESSAVYQFATEMAHCAGLAGFKNLHAGMFITGDIKHSMEKYLLAESKSSTSSAISLYVPETLGKCEFMVKGATVPLIRPCEEYLKTFMDITQDDRWIGLLIWQHATVADHTKDTEFLKEFPGAEYQCTGCEASGKEREKAEGKPYEGHVYAQSMKNGRRYIEMAPGGRYEIHNAGRPGGKSIMWDYSMKAVEMSERGKTADRFSEIMKASAEGILYVDKRVEGVPMVAERNAMNAASTWKSVLELPNPTKSELRNAVVKVNTNAMQKNPLASQERQERRREAIGDTASVLRNVANKVRDQNVNATRNATATATAKRIRESSYSLNAMKQAEKNAANAHQRQRDANATANVTANATANAKAKAKAKAKNETRKKAAIAARSDESFLAKVAAAKAANAKRAANEAQRAINEAKRASNEAEGTPEAAAKRLAALRMPSAKEQETAMAAAKAAKAQRAANEAQWAAQQAINEGQRRRNEAKRAANEAEGTPEAAAKRLAALRMPSAKEQEAAMAAAKKMGVARREANAKRAINEAAAAKEAAKQSAVLRNAEAAAAAYQSPKRSANRAERAQMNRFSYSGNVLTDDSMVGSVIDI